MENDEKPWYVEGLSFACTRCGACCTGAPGYVWTSAEEIERLATFRGESVEEFGRAFLRRVGDHVSLIERPNGDCVFWDASAGCTVYEARPDQCRTWPFWDQNIETRADWDATRAVCPGAGRGRLFSVEEIEALAKRSPL